MADSIEMHPKVFISYSWSGEVAAIKLAEQLLANGIDVVFDKYDLEPGQDLHAFMERAVHDETVTHVLILCSPDYTKKADGRADRAGKGTGVAKETLIITPDVYADANQRKYLPVLIERNDDGTESMPIYLRGRMYIDLSNQATYDSQFQELVRTIYGQKIYTKPELAGRPKFLDPNQAPHLSALESKAHLVTSAVNPRARSAAMMDFRDAFDDALRQVPKLVKSPPESQGHHAWMLWGKMIDIRNVYLDILQMLARSGEDTEDMLPSFFEHLAWSASGSREIKGTLQDASKILLWEMFLYTIAYLRRHANYTTIATLVNYPYSLELTSGEKISGDFATVFYYRSNHLEDEYKRAVNKSNINSLQANELCKNRLYDSLDVTQQDLGEADAFLYQINIAQTARRNIQCSSGAWFPVCFPYGPNSELDEWRKFRSRSFCKKNASLIGCETVDEVKRTLANVVPPQRELFPGMWLPGPKMISQIISPQQVGIDP